MLGNSMQVAWKSERLENANKWWLAKLANARGPADEREGIGVHQEPGDKDPHHHELGAQGTEQPRHPYAEFTSQINQDSANGRSGMVRDELQWAV